MIDCLDGPLAAAERNFVREELQGLLAFQLDLARWSQPRTSPPRLRAAMPIVSLYVRGELRGCQAYGAGPSEQRLARAFLAASADSRFAPLESAERAQIVAQASYALRLRRVSTQSAGDEFMAGVHGLVLVADARPVLLVPDVARDLGLDEEGFLSVLEEKANLSRAEWHEHELYAFETERVVARLEPPVLAREAALPAALNWLARQVDDDGRVRFGLDSRSGEVLQRGPLRHARAASVIQVLTLDATTASTAERARSWLGRELAQAHSGGAVEDWPDAVGPVAATWALACLAGLPGHSTLKALASSPELHAEPWHAAQVVAALGHEAPDALWQTCVNALADQPFAPWTAIAAHRRTDREIFERALANLLASLPNPEWGFVSEPALAGLTLEALAFAESTEVQRRRTATLDLLRRSQLWSDCDPSPVPGWVEGAFPLAPNQTLLRCDATAHAALALVSS